MSVRPFYFMGHYQSWWKTRIDTLDHILVPDFFKGKTIYDIGSGFGTFAGYLKDRGASHVIASEGRQEYVDVIKSRFGDCIETRCEDYDNPNFEIDTPVDIICHFGVMQYIANIESHLDKLIGKSQYIFIECDVIDSNDPDLVHRDQPQTGYDQSLNGAGSHFSPAYLEHLLAERGLTFVCVTESSLDTMVHKYTWQIKNTKKLAPGQARFWICAQAGYKLDPIFSKLYNSTIRPIFESVISEVREVIYDSIVSYDFLPMAIAKRQSRINVYALKDQTEDAIDKLIAGGYKVIDHPYKSSIIAKRPPLADLYSILAVATEQDDTTFVIQGLDAGVITEITRNVCFTYGEVLVSTWAVDTLDECKREVANHKYYNKQNIYMHSTGTLRGLQRVKTPFAVKIRADEYYTDLRPILAKIRACHDIVVTNNVFARTTTSFPYHISDHLIAGRTENLLIMFEAALSSIKAGISTLPGMRYFVAEQRFTMTYLTRKLNCTLESLVVKQIPDIRQLMHENFFIVPVKQLGAFHISANSMARKSLTQNSTPREYRAFIDIESIDSV